MRARKIVLGLVIVALVAGTAFWAGSTIGRPPAEPEAAPEHTVYEVTEGEIGQSLQLSAVARWDLVDAGRSPASGTVTTVEIPEDGTIDTGDSPFSVDLRPVTISLGDVPMFRDLALDDRGADVEQLQRFLAGVHSPSPAVDGVFDADTDRAVRDWQRILGVEPDGVVRAGDPMFVPELPVRIVLADGVEVGAVVTAGQHLLRRVPDTPTLTLTVPEGQFGVNPGSAVLATIDGSRVEGELGAPSADPESASTVYPVTATDGAVLCGAECDAVVPVPGPVQIPLEVVVTPAVTGPLVPVAAITTGADGAAAVTLADGTRRPVVQLVTANGMAVVEGVRPGDRLRLPAGP